MNNAFAKDEEIDTTPVLRERQVKLTKIIEAINALSGKKEWQALKDLVFNKELDRIERSLQSEAKKIELSAPDIYRLQGEYKWAKRYSDLYKLAETYKTELSSISKKIQETNENAII